MKENCLYKLDCTFLKYESEIFKAKLQTSSNFDKIESEKIIE